MFPPQPAGNQHFWTVSLHCREEGLASKTGAFDDAIALDMPHHQWLGPLLHQLRSTLAPDSLLVDIEAHDYNNAFRTAAQRLGLPRIDQAVPYQLRHAGASDGKTSGRRRLAEVKLRGRWSSDRSVAHYAKGGRTADQISRLAPKVVRHAAVCHERLGEILALRSPPCEWREAKA